MFCPTCKAEYRPGFTRCPDCHVDLVGHLPAEKQDWLRFETNRFEPAVVIRTYQDAIEADLAKTALDAASIPSIISNRIARQYISPALPLQLWVRVEDVENAEKILDIKATD
jgi:hypothetical protein